VKGAGSGGEQRHAAGGGEGPLVACGGGGGGPAAGPGHGGTGSSSVRATLGQGGQGPMTRGPEATVSGGGGLIRFKFNFKRIQTKFKSYQI
jgi:hypothetical protein